MNTVNRHPATPLVPARLGAAISALLATLASMLLLVACGEQTGTGATAGPDTRAPKVSAPASAASSASGEKSAASAAPALPSYWYATDIEGWVGKRWNEIDLFHYMKTKPSGMDRGGRIVVFYSRTCDHCEAMFNDDLATDPGLAATVTAVEVPQSKVQLTDPKGWSMPETACELLSLPLGADWIITTPMTLRIEDGVITCAQENEHKNCMGLE